MPGTLHITNGDSVEIRDTGLEGDVLTWKDALHEGPVPGGLNLDELRPVRARYLASLDHLPEAEIMADLERRDRTLAEFRERSEVVSGSSTIFMINCSYSRFSTGSRGRTEAQPGSA